MAGPLLPVSHIRDKFEAAVAHDRRDAILFSILTVILTPVFLLLAVFAVLLGVNYSDLPYVDELGYARSFALGITISITFLFMAFFIRPKAQWRTTKSDLFWVGGALGILALLYLLSIGTRLSLEAPGFFWILYGFLALTMMGFLGHAYVPHDDYYLGWYGGMWDNPFTVRDDIDRAHLSLGFAVAVPRLIMGSYGEIFGSFWIWKGLSESELHRGSEVLHALGTHDSSRARSLLQSTDQQCAAHLARALHKLKLVSPGRDGVRLTSDGEKLVGISEWH